MSPADYFKQFISTQLTSAAGEIFGAFKNIVEYEEEIDGQHKLQFINTRLTAAAEEIFGAFKSIIVKYEEEIYRQRKLQDDAREPEIKMHRIELPLQHVCKEEEVLLEQQHCNQERNSLMDQEDSEAPQMKEEEEEVCICQEGEQLEVKQETDAFMSTPTDEENDHTEEKTLCLNSDETLRAPQKESAVNMPVIISVVRAPNSDQLLSNHSHAARSRDLKGETCAEDVNFESKIHFKLNTELPLQHACKKEETLSDQQSCKQDRNPPMDQEDSEASQLKEEQEELSISQEEEHLAVKQETDAFMVATDEKNNRIEEKTQHLNPDEPLSAAQKESTVYIPVIISVVRATNSDQLLSNDSHAAERRDVDFRANTGDGPYICKPCGRVFKLRSALSIHMRVHTGEKPYTCDTCGQVYRYSGHLTEHMRRAHTGERPYHCKICGKSFPVNSAVKKHMVIHTDERPYVCETCGKDYRRQSDLTLHKRKAHTDEGLYFANLWKTLADT